MRGCWSPCLKLARTAHSGSPFPAAGREGQGVRHPTTRKETTLDISAFNPPDYGLIDDDPLTFKQQFQAFIDALTAYQSGQGDAEAVNAQLRMQVEELGTRLADAEQQAQLHLEAAEAAKTAHNVAVAA